MDWFLEPFALGFQQRALLGGLIAAIMSSAVGVWLVLRGMSFFGDAFAHGILPGIATAILLGINPALGAIVAALLMVLLIEYTHRTTRLHEDTTIGLLFVAMMSLGVVIISKSDAYTGSLTAILFGDALGITPELLRGMLLPAVLVLLGSVLLYRPLLVLSFSQAKAQTLGMRPRLVHALLLVLIAAAVIVSFRSVGTMLVFGLLVGPPAAASLTSRTVPGMYVRAIVIAVVSVWLGLVLSYHLGTAGSATMALVPILLFFVVLVATQVRDRIRRVRATAAAPSRGSADDAAPEAACHDHSHADIPAAGGDEHAVAEATAASNGLFAEADGLVLAHGAHVAVDASTFRLPSGQLVAVIGPNGSGKSTLLHALAGIDEPHGGSLRVLGGDPRRASHRVAYVMQSVDLPSGVPVTVKEVVGMGRYPSLGWFRPFRRSDRERVRWAMEQVDISDLAGRHLTELSGGQRQRVYVAQALAQDHVALLLDEPLTGLDVTSAGTIDRILHSERERGHSVVMTTHDLEEAGAADQVVLMSGRVRAHGSPAEVLTTRNLQAAYGLGALHGGAEEHEEAGEHEVAGDARPVVVDDPHPEPEPQRADALPTRTGTTRTGPTRTGPTRRL